MTVVRDGKVWDVVVSRKCPTSLAPVWLCAGGDKLLLCQVQNSGRFGWAVVVHGKVSGLRLVEGFKQRWQAIKYAINVRFPRDDD